MMKNDPIIDNIRKVRKQISERFEHDPARLVDHYIEIQKKYQNRVLEKQSKVDEVDTDLFDDLVGIVSVHEDGSVNHNQH